jgi:hypothetical protein
VNNASNLLKLRLYEQQKTALPKMEAQWCKKQIADYELIMSSMNDIICAAMSSGKSAQHYTMLEDAKLNFVEQLIQMGNNYRMIEEV